MSRPHPNEYVAFYATYIDLIKNDHIVEVLDKQQQQLKRFINSIPSDKALFAYAPGKWTVKEVIGHLIDVERIMAYRALRFARFDQTPLVGFEENDYVAAANFNSRELSDLADELISLRKANVLLFRTFTEEMLQNTGKANGHPISVRALLFVMAGHIIHHKKVLKERYSL